MAEPPPADRRPPAPWGRRAAYMLALAVGLANLPKPLHIDDTLYVRIAQQIVRRPLDPYGFRINWQGVEQPAHEVSISPPLLSYWHAALLGLGADADWGLHAGMLPWLALAAWALLDLGERAGIGAWLALLTLGGPCVAGACNLMIDVPLLAATAAGLASLLRALDGGGLRWWLLAALAAAAAPLLKYAGAALALAYLATGCRRGMRAFLWCFLAALPAALAVWGWQAWSRHLYGATQLAEAGGFLQRFQQTMGEQLPGRVLTAGCVLALTCPFWLLAFARLRLRTRLGLLALTVAFALWQDPAGGRRSAFVAFGAFGLLGAAALLFPARRSAAACPSRTAGLHAAAAAFCLGVAGVSLLGAPFVAARYFLPMHPLLLLLALRGSTPSRWTLATLCALTWTVGGAVAWAEFRWAAVYPNAARQMLAGHAGPASFTGHWGWQWSLEALGARAWDRRSRSAPPGALVLVPLRADAPALPPALLAGWTKTGELVVPPHPWRISTWSAARHDAEAIGLRFHGANGPHLPWGFAGIPTERIARWRAP